MHRSGDEEDAGLGKGRIDKMVETAALDARAVGRLADLRIGPEQLFLQTTEQTRMSLCISDPHLQDCPIVYCNQAFLDLTGYPRDEVVGRNCRFLQGELTRASAVARLRQAQATRDYTVVHILNYRKDGTPFWNAVHVGPIYDEKGELAYFFGSQWDITELITARETIDNNERVASELRHRTDNLFAVLIAIIRMSARESRDVDDLADSLETRIEALATAHRVSLADDDPNKYGSDLRYLAEEVLRPYRNSYPAHVEIVGTDVHLSRRMVTPVGLTLHELATNAVKYGALADNEGKLKIDWEPDGADLVIHWTEHRSAKAKKVDISNKVQGGGSGSRLIDNVIRAMHGSIETNFEPEGFRATIRIPNPES